MPPDGWSGQARRGFRRNCNTCCKNKSCLHLFTKVYSTIIALSNLKNEPMSTYQLNRKDLGAKGFHYTVTDEHGNIVTQRKSARDYVACTVNGQFYFGRLDLIGKGDHGKQLKWCAEKGITPTPIAYLAK